MEIARTFAPPIIDGFVELARTATTDVTIISPFITTFGIKSLVRSLPDDELSLRVCSRFNSQTFNQKSSDFAALQILSDWNERWDVKYFRLPRLHAKIFLFDDLCIVSSANLTQGGLRTNYEFGLTIADASSVPRLRPEIEKIISASCEVSLDEIAEYASQAQRVLPPEDSDIEEVELVVEGLEENEPEEVSVYSERDLDLIKKFDRELEARLSLDAMETPVGRPSFIDHLRVVHDEDDSREELYDAASKDIERIDAYLDEFIELNRFSQESKPCLQQLFVHTSFNHTFRKNEFHDGIEAGLDSLASAGVAFVKLYLFHNAFRGNYRWIEALGYFEIWARQSIAELETNSILESLGANWLIHFTDIRPSWRRDNLFKLLGVAIRFDPNRAWSLLNRFIDPNELLALGAFRSIDAKTALQEALQEHGVRPDYSEISRDGEDHSLTFNFSAHALGCVGHGSGPSKKMATQDAAAGLLRELKEKKLIRIDAGVQERRPATGIQPYKLTEERFRRVKRACDVFGFRASDVLIDCALTPVNERAWARETRSNEKFALVGSKVVEIVQWLVEFDNRVKSAPQIELRITNKLLEKGFLKTFPQLDEFIGDYYSEESEKNRQSVFDAIVGLLWLSERERAFDIMRSIIQSVWNEATAKESTQLLQEYVQERRDPLPRYVYFEEGQGHAKSYTCRVYLDEKLVGVSSKCNSKKAARRGAAEQAVAELGLVNRTSENNSS